jgi:hypothetical protein
MTSTGRHRSWKRAIPWVIAVLDLVMLLTAIFVWPPRGRDYLGDIFLALAFPISYGGVGAFLTVRVARNPIGPLLLAATTGFALMGVAESYAVTSSEVAGGTWPGTTLAGLASLVLWPPSLAIALIGVPLIFPNGSLISARWRWVAAGAVLVVVVTTLGTLFLTPVISPSGFANPLAIPALDPWLGPLVDLAEWGAIAVIVAAASAPLVRYRRGGQIERHQVRWLAAGCFIVVVGFSVSSVVPFAETIGLMTLAVLPISIGIAILRYHLYEIDRIVSRTIGYALVTATLLVVFAIVVVGLQALLAPFTRGDTVPVAASTLVVFALFQPLHRRVQSAIDRRFNRARYDGERTVAELARRLRDEVDLDAIIQDLRAVMGSTVQPGSASVWIRIP